MQNNVAFFLYYMRSHVGDAVLSDVYVIITAFDHVFLLWSVISKAENIKFSL